MWRLRPKVRLPRHNRGSPFFGRLHRLTVDNSSARLPIAAMDFPHIPAQSARVAVPMSPTTANFESSRRPSDKAGSPSAAAAIGNRIPKPEIP
jgi:hypothetical protein